jgi:uncharacterized membrane protein YfcA
LFATGLAAGFVDSIAGGGGLISLPVMLNVGLPPAFALGTNKLQATFGSATATWHFVRTKLVNLSACKLGLVCTFIGALTGTILVQQLDPAFLKRFIPIVLLLVAGYMIFRPEVGAADIHPRMTPDRFYIIAGLTLGFYDGFFGPGVGTFWAMAFMLGLGFNMAKATGYTKAMNFTSNLVSFAFFALAGHVNYAAGLTMGVGQLIGAQAGSGLVVKRGAKFVRPIFLTMVLVLVLKLLYDSLRRRG